MAQRLVELCTLFVENTYGELAAQIFSALASRGRSSVATLAQLIRIHSDHIRAGLALLIQHHLVKYYDQEDDPRIPTFYHADLNAAYNLIRAHKYINIVSEREGEAAGKLLANIFELGHASVGDLENEYELTPGSKRDSGIDTFEHRMTGEGMVNGIAKDGKHKTPADISTIAEFHSTLRKLLDQGYLIKASQRSYMPNADYEKEATEVVMNQEEDVKNSKLSGSKKQQHVDAHVNNLKRKWEDEDTYSKTRDVASKGAIKRSKQTSPSNKRVKVNGDIPNGIHDEASDDETEECVPKLPNDLFVRVNFAKCTLLLRNRRLEQMAHFHLGAVPAAVFGAALRALEDREVKGKAMPVPSKHDDDDNAKDPYGFLPMATDVEVLEQLNKAIDLTQGVKTENHSSIKPNGVHKRKILSDDPDEAELGIKIEKDSDDEEMDEAPPINPHKLLKERNKRLALVSMHLNILAEHTKHFIRRTPDKKASHIDIAALTARLVQDEVDTMIGNRYSTIETRIVRCLRERGKLEEKSVQTMCMMRLMPLRMHLTFLQFAGICDSQEVPKDASRQPNRSVHLWSFNEKRVVNQYLRRAYQGMARSLQRLRVEREGKFRAVIEKAERVDVKGREQELLNLAEKNLLKEWRDTEERLLVQVDRLDDLVGVLRDFPGTDTSLAHD